MGKKITRKEAVELLGLDEKLFDNYFKNAEEFPSLRDGGKGRFYFDKDVLREWKSGYDWRTVILTKNDYARCLDFALAKHFGKYVASDFGTGRQREFGQKITNWVKGQLGEIAVQKFLGRNFGVAIELDFEIRPDIVRQDVIGVNKDNKIRTPNLGVGIKSSKPKNAYLILSENELGIEGRRSDVYIYCRPDIPDDHLLRVAKEKIEVLVSGQQHFSEYKADIPDFADIPCEVAGWCEYGELERVTEIPGQKFDGIRFVKKSGLLRKSKEEWKRLVSRL